MNSKTLVSRAYVNISVGIYADEYLFSLRWSSISHRWLLIWTNLWLRYGLLPRWLNSLLSRIVYSLVYDTIGQQHDDWHCQEESSKLKLCGSRSIFIHRWVGFLQEKRSYVVMAAGWASSFSFPLDGRYFSFESFLALVDKLFVNCTPDAVVFVFLSFWYMNTKLVKRSSLLHGEMYDYEFVFYCPSNACRPTNFATINVWTNR